MKNDKQSMIISLISLNKQIINQIKTDKKQIETLKSRLITLTMAVKANSKKQKNIVKEIFIIKGKIIKLPEKTKCEKYHTKIKSDIKKNLNSLKPAEQDEMLKRLMAIREERQKQV